MTMFVHNSIMLLIVGTPVDAAIGMNNLRLVNCGASNLLVLEMKASTKPVIGNY